MIEANERFRTRRAVDPLAASRACICTSTTRAARSSSRPSATTSWCRSPRIPGRRAPRTSTRGSSFTSSRDHLTPDGVFVQWIDLDLVDQPLLGSLVATLLDAFPHVRIYRPFFRGTALFLASGAPLDVEANAGARARRVAGRAGARRGADARGRGGGVGARRGRRARARRGRAAHHRRPQPPRDPHDPRDGAARIPRGGRAPGAARSAAGAPRRPRSPLSRAALARGLGLSAGRVASSRRSAIPSSA